MTRGVAPPPLRWWGWGERDVAVPEGLLRVVDDELGVRAVPDRRVRHLEDVEIPDSRLPASLRRRLVEVAGGFHVRSDAEERIRHAAGRSYLDLVRLRSGVLPEAPDAVVHPANGEEVLATLRACSEAGCAVVPFGGGTSVVGGVAPLRTGTGPLIALDVDRLDAVRDVDRRSLTADIEAGVRGPRIESELRRRGLTLGHFPQSFEYATAGGFAATRSAGQASSGRGRFDQLLAGLRLQAPAAEVVVAARPPSAEGPSLLQLVAGSEGAFGVISEVTVRVSPRPRMCHYRAWALADLDSGLELLRALAQSRWTPDVTRLSDAEETRLTLAAAGRAGAAARTYLGLRGQPDPCLLIVGWEGDGWSVGVRTRAAAGLLRRAGAVRLGERPARAWLRERFAGPYLRDSLLDRGLLVETLETGTVWSRLQGVRDAVLAALRGTLAGLGSPPLIGTHVSHVYAEGAALYFTVLARRLEGSEADQWLTAKGAATEALVAAGALLSHHHGIGADHARWLEAVHGARALALLRGVKRDLDPAGVMNPGKLLP